MFFKWIRRRRFQIFRSARPNFRPIYFKESWTRDVFIMDR